MNKNKKIAVGVGIVVLVIIIARVFFAGGAAQSGINIKIGFASRCLTALDIPPPIADHIALRNINPIFFSGLDNHARQGFSTIAMISLYMGAKLDVIYF